MRLQVVGEDVYEVKRTHITNKLRDIGTSFCDFIKSLCESNKTTFVWDEKYLDYACVTFKSVDEDDLFEILILTEKKEEALDIVKKMFDNGCYSAIDNNTVIISTKDWNKYLNM